MTSIESIRHFLKHDLHEPRIYGISVNDSVLTVGLIAGISYGLLVSYPIHNFDTGVSYTIYFFGTTAVTVPTFIGIHWYFGIKTGLNKLLGIA
jgi:hypothetical protein